MCSRCKNVAVVKSGGWIHLARDDESPKLSNPLVKPSATIRLTVFIDSSESSPSSLALSRLVSLLGKRCDQSTPIPRISLPLDGLYHPVPRIQGKEDIPPILV